MHLHFVCTGNAHRSRLAEAYCRSLIKNSTIKVSSSGISTKIYRRGNGPICWYTMRLMKRHGLIPFMSWSEHQTTKAILKNVDLLICMNQSHLDYCQKNLDFQGKFEVWNIPDLNEMEGFIPSTVPGIKTDINHITLSEQTYEMIANKVDNLLQCIK